MGGVSYTQRSPHNIVKPFKEKIAKGALYGSSEKYRTFASVPQIATDIACWDSEHHVLRNIAPFEDFITNTAAYIRKIIDGELDPMSQEYQCPDCGRAIYYEGSCDECYQRQERESYQALSEADIAKKIDEIIAVLDEDFYEKDENEVFSRLLAYCSLSTERIAAAANRAGVYFPWELYRDAGPNTRKDLITLLMNPDCLEASLILQCLAIAGGEDVLAAFTKLDKQPQPWAKNLYIPLSVYAQAGGWTFSQEGKRIELNYDRCYPVFPIAGQMETAGTGVSVAVPRDDICPHCGTKKLDILAIDGEDGRLAFLNLSGIVTVTVCPMCAMTCERTIVRYTPNDGSTMEVVRPVGNGEKMPDSDYEAMTTKAFSLAPKAESLFFARGSDEAIITIGGFARWIQGFRYDSCPDCGKIMRYLASVPWQTLSDSSEGTLFMELCSECCVISAFHQQT